MEERFGKFVFSILALNKYVNKIKTVEMEEFGLKSVHCVICYALAKNPDGMTSADLVRMVIEDKGQISRALKELYSKDLIEYSGKKYNALVKLTENGWEVTKKISVKIDNAVMAGSRGITDSEREILYKCLTIVCENLDKYYSSLEGKNHESI